MAPRTRGVHHEALLLQVLGEDLRQRGARRCRGQEPGRRPTGVAAGGLPGKVADDVDGRAQRQPVADAGGGEIDGAPHERLLADGPDRLEGRPRRGQRPGVRRRVGELPGERDRHPFDVDEAGPREQVIACSGPTEGDHPRLVGDGWRVGEAQRRQRPRPGGRLDVAPRPAPQAMSSRRSPVVTPRWWCRATYSRQLLGSLRVAKSTARRPHTPRRRVASRGPCRPSSSPPARRCSCFDRAPPARAVPRRVHASRTAPSTARWRRARRALRREREVATRRGGRVALDVDLHGAAEEVGRHRPAASGAGVRLRAHGRRYGWRHRTVRGGRQTPERCSCTERIAADPSPTAAATRLVEPDRRSPTAKSPGQFVS